ncbi:AMED_5909 family protein [Lentzea sp. NPDC051213]|uniref:AMED_5909 family protein n=1 Tax=Lentzea sp. NPDC051213 TaxID=3364126 RepID=UPI00378BC25E
MRQQTDFWAMAMTATTLQEAHEVLSRLEPPPSSPSATRRDYHLRSVAVYERIADVDRGHHHEALYWVGREQRKAAEHAVSPRSHS